LSTEFDDKAPVAAGSNQLFANYLIVAFVFLVLGMVLGVVGASSLADSNQDLIDNAVVAALAGQENQISGLFDEALVEALANVQPAQPTAVPTPDPNIRYDVDINGDPFIGAEDAVITIVEFSDFRCGYCNRFRVETLPEIMENYDGLVRFVYRDFPVLGSNSMGAALAAECADDQGRFWEYHDELFDNQGLIGPDYFTQLAEELELDMDQFQTCLDDQTHQDEVTEDFEAARDVGARGTPAFLINGKFVSGAQPYANFAAIIDAELAALAEEQG
jgi:protein-disulfide isomerase